MRRIFFNQHWWENRIKYQPLVQRLFLLLNLSEKFPATLNLEPTNFCNLDCLFCPVKRTNRSRGFIKWRFYQRVIDEIAQGGKLKVLWLNKDGEPLLHPKIDKMVAAAKKKKVADRIEIYTNGLLFDKSMAKKLVNSGLDSLVVSLDATDRKSFKKFKRKDGYEQVVANINNFLRIRGELRARNPLLSVKTINFGDNRAIEKFKRVWRGAADSVVVQPLHQWEGSIKSLKVQRFKGLKGRYPCNLPWLSPAVNWDGKMVPCCVNFKENELVMGDLREQSLAEIWRGDKFKKLRQAHLDQDFSQWPTCARCTFWKQLPGMSPWLKRVIK